MPIDFPSAAIAIGALLLGAALSELRASREASRRRDEQAESRRFEREQTAEARLFERRAGAYVEVITALARTQEKVSNALPVIGWHRNPFELTDEERVQLGDEARRVDALVVAFGSAELRAMLKELRRVERRFFINAERYEREGGDAGDDPRDRYDKAEDIRSEYRTLMNRIRDRVGEELGAIRPAPSAPVSGQ
jgi:vacuolar-type H+-ATPase subunit I/STV1